MSEEQPLYTILPEAFKPLRSFDAKGTVHILKAGPIEYPEIVSAALPKVVTVVYRVDQAMLRKELLANGISEEAITSICNNLTMEGKVELRDNGPPIFMRKGIYF